MVNPANPYTNLIWIAAPANMAAHKGLFFDTATAAHTMTAAAGNSPNIFPTCRLVMHRDEPTANAESMSPDLLVLSRSSRPATYSQANDTINIRAIKRLSPEIFHSSASGPSMSGPVVMFGSKSQGPNPFRAP